MWVHKQQSFLHNSIHMVTPSECVPRKREVNIAFYVCSQRQKQLYFSFYHTRSNYSNILKARMAYLVIFSLPNSLNMLNFDFSYLFYLTERTRKCTQVLKYGRSSRRRLRVQLHCSC